MHWKSTSKSFRNIPKKLIKIPKSTNSACERDGNKDLVVNSVSPSLSYIELAKGKGG